MALQPSLRPLLIVGRYDAPHTLEAFVDFVCPYSAKLAKTINTTLRPQLSPGGKYDGKVKIILRLQVQPWHGSSTFTHEAALAVSRVSPEAFWPFSLLLFANQEAYFDIPSSKLTPLQIRTNLATLASQVLDKTKVEEFKDLLVLKGTPNGGVAVTDDLKYTVKYSRQNGIHVSPSVLWDGILNNQVSSSWGEKEWSKFLSEKVTV